MFATQLASMADETPLKGWLDEDSPEGLLAKIYFASSEAGFALKGSAWQEIDEETYLAILRGVLALSLIKENESSFWNFRIHILEQAHLRRLLAIHTDDSLPKG